MGFAGIFGKDVPQEITSESRRLETLLTELFPIPPDGNGPAIDMAVYFKDTDDRPNPGGN
jgi:hypothetical protein